MPYSENVHSNTYSALKSFLSLFFLMFFPGHFRVQVGMVLNTMALYVFCLRTKLKTTSVIYTINLAVTDLLVNLSLPTRILLYYSGGTCLLCSYLHIFSYFVNMYCSILFLTCICVDRYISIVQVSYLDYYWVLLLLLCYSCSIIPRSYEYRRQYAAVF